MKKMVELDDTLKVVMLQWDKTKNLGSNSLQGETGTLNVCRFSSLQNR